MYYRNHPNTYILQTVRHLTPGMIKYGRFATLYDKDYEKNQCAEDATFSSILKVELIYP